MPRANFAMRPEVSEKLSVLADAYGLSRSAWLALKINQEYDVLQGSPEIRKKLEILKEMRKLANELGSADNSSLLGSRNGTSETPASLT